MIVRGRFRVNEFEQLINVLTDGEGDTVTFCCQNPDFNGLPNEAIIVNASWTNWEDKYFRANTKWECLNLAIQDMKNHG